MLPLIGLELRLEQMNEQTVYMIDDLDKLGGDNTFS
jgi:hypothetical protein